MDSCKTKSPNVKDLVASLCSTCYCGKGHRLDIPDNAITFQLCTALLEVNKDFENHARSFQTQTNNLSRIFNELYSTANIPEIDRLEAEAKDCLRALSTQDAEWELDMEDFPIPDVVDYFVRGGVTNEQAIQEFLACQAQGVETRYRQETHNFYPEEAKLQICTIVAGEKLRVDIGMGTHDLELLGHRVKHYEVDLKGIHRERLVNVWKQGKGLSQEVRGQVIARARGIVQQYHDAVDSMSDRVSDEILIDMQLEGGYQQPANAEETARLMENVMSRFPEKEDRFFTGVYLCIDLMTTYLDELDFDVAPTSE